VNSFDLKDRAVGIIGGITVVTYLAATALTPAHAPNSESTGVQILRYATVNRSRRCSLASCSTPSGWRCW
jgi:cobalamin synthase